MFITAVCVLFLIKLRWPKSLYNTSVTLVFFAFLADASVTFVGEPHLTLAHSRARINVAKIIS